MAGFQPPPPHPFLYTCITHAPVCLQVTFSPDHAFEFFRATADLFFGREDSKKTLYFAGSGWAQGMFLMCPTGVNVNHTHDVLVGRPAENEEGLAVEDIIFWRTETEDPFLSLGDLPVKPRYKGVGCRGAKARGRGLGGWTVVSKG